MMVSWRTPKARTGRAPGGCCMPFSPLTIDAVALTLDPRNRSYLRDLGKAGCRRGELMEAPAHSRRVSPSCDQKIREPASAEPSSSDRWTYVLTESEMETLRVVTGSGGRKHEVTGTTRSGLDRLRRSADILMYLGRNGPVTVSEISVALSLPVSSCHDLLKDMTEINLTSMYEGKRYSLGSRAVALGAEIVGGIDVTRVSRPHLERLVKRTELDAYLAVRSGGHIVYSARCQGSMPVNIDIRLGRPLYLHSTAVGKLFAALDPYFTEVLFRLERKRLTPTTLVGDTELEEELERIRSKGTSISRGESYEGILGFAAPVWDAGHNLVACVHASVFQTQIEETKVPIVLSIIEDSAADITADLGNVRYAGQEA
jgi:DNA-binding IclR family transcriptional regulator